MTDRNNAENSDNEENSDINKQEEENRTPENKNTKESSPSSIDVEVIKNIQTQIASLTQWDEIKKMRMTRFNLRSGIQSISPEVQSTNTVVV